MRTPCGIEVRRGLATLIVLAMSTGPLPAQDVKALVGGTLIDGFGRPPIRNSVVLIEGERIRPSAQSDTLPVPAGPRSSPPRA